MASRYNRTDRKRESTSRLRFGLVLPSILLHRENAPALGTVDSAFSFSFMERAPLSRSLAGSEIITLLCIAVDTVHMPSVRSGKRGSGVTECCSSDKLRPRPNLEERVSRKDAKIGVKAAKKPAEKNEILRVCFAGGFLVAAPPAAVYAAFRRLIASDCCFFLQGCLAALAPIFASLRETLLSCLGNTQLPHHRKRRPTKSRVSQAGSE